MSRRARTASLPDLVGREEACEILGIDKTTLHRWIKSGYLVEPRRVGGRPVWTRADIEQFAQEKGRQRAAASID